MLDGNIYCRTLSLLRREADSLFSVMAAIFACELFNCREKTENDAVEIE